MKKQSGRIKANQEETPAVSKERKVKPRFEAGRVFVERQVLDKFSLAAINEFLTNHVECVTGPCSDWQSIDDVCLRDGGPMFSMFRDDLGNEGYILTDPDRTKTMMMMRNK